VPQRTNLAVDFLLDELAAESVMSRRQIGARTIGIPALPSVRVPDAPVVTDPVRRRTGFRPVPDGSVVAMPVPGTQSTARPAVALLVAGFCSFGPAIWNRRKPFLRTTIKRPPVPAR
jgi:hypothetical protein